MPTTKNAFTRYKILDDLLSNRYHDYSLDDLTREVNERLSEMYPDSDGVGRRTIEKDIYYIEYEGPFMAEIERYSTDSYDPEGDKTYTKRCLRYADPSFSIFKKEMSQDEEYLLKEGLSILGQFDGLPNLDRLESLRLRLNAGTIDRQILSFTKNPLENSNLLGQLFTSISQRQVVELHYHTFYAPDTDLSINLNPYLLREYNRRWYLIASSERDCKLLNFCLDRIDLCIPLPSHTYRECEGDINEHFKNVVGVTVYEQSPVYNIIFWVSDFSWDYVKTKPIHESQIYINGERESMLHKRYPTLEGGAFYSIDCKLNYELIRELTSFGKDLIVLEPQSIRNQIFTNICDLQKEYTNLRT